MEGQSSVGLENMSEGGQVIRVVGEKEPFDWSIGDVGVVRVNNTVLPCHVMNYHAILIRRKSAFVPLPAPGSLDEIIDVTEENRAFLKLFPADAFESLWTIFL